MSQLGPKGWNLGSLVDKKGLNLYQLSTHKLENLLERSPSEPMDSNSHLHYVQAA